MDFKNKIILITGASRGIGRAAANKLYNLGCNVVGVYKSRDDMATSLLKECPNILMIKGDVGQEETAKQAVVQAVEKFGGLDVLINNAGINILGDIVDYKLADWEEMLRVDLTAKFLFAKYSIPHLKKSADGNIINISSRLGMAEYVDPSSVPYGAVNAGTNILSIGLSRELQDSGIRVNTVIPTVTDTDRFRDVFTPEEQKQIIKKGKLGTAEEVAETIVGILNDGKKTGETTIDPRVKL